MFENLNLIQLNKLLEEKIKECELISDLNLTKEQYEEILNKVIDILGYANKGVNLERLINSNSLVFATVLVYIAMYEYEGNYWDKAKEILQLYDLSYNDRYTFGDNFLKVISKYNLKNFNDGGYKYITPIMCHAGIPNKSLAGIFDIMLDNYDDNTLTAEALIDNIKYFISHKVDSTVYRFITCNEDRAITFLHNLKDLITIIEENSLTLSDSLSKYSYLDERILIQYYKWRSEKKVDREKRHLKNRIVSPKIKFDSASLGVYILLPVQHVNKQYNDCIEWNIEFDNEDTITILGSLYFQNNECISQEQTITLKPSSKYKVNLFYEGNILGEWIYDGIDEVKPCIIFDEDDNLVKGNKISDKSITCILKEEYNILENDVEIIYYNFPNNHWSKFKCIIVKLLGECDLIKLLSLKNEFTIEYKKVNLIELEGGNLLFNESYRKDEISTYSNILPLISLEYGNNFLKGMILDTYSVNILNLKENINITEKIKSIGYRVIKDRITIDLNDIEIFNNIYGEYEVRILEGRNIKRVFTLRYLPNISISEDNLDKWPKGTKGYVKNSFKITCPNNVVFNFSDCIQEEMINDSIKKHISIESTSYSEYLMGTVDIMQSNKIITFPAKRKIRSLQWSLIKEGDHKIQWQNDYNTIFIKELLENNYNLVMKINDNVHDEYVIKVYLLDPKGQVYQESISNFRRDKLQSIPLNRFLDSVKANEASRYYIKIEVYNIYSLLLSSFIPTIIKDKIEAKNISYMSDDFGVVSIKWNQDGNIENQNMVLKIHDISKPWKGAISIPLDKGNFNIENNNCSLLIDNNEFLIQEDGIYLFEIENDSGSEELLFESDQVFKPIKIKKSSVYKYRVNFEKI